MPPPSKRKQSASTAATAAGETHRAAARRRTDQQLAEHESEDASLADVALDELSATGTATSAAPSSSAAAQAKSMFYDVGIDDVVLGKHGQHLRGDLAVIRLHGRIGLLLQEVRGWVRAWVGAWVRHG